MPRVAACEPWRARYLRLALSIALTVAAVLTVAGLVTAMRTAPREPPPSPVLVLAPCGHDPCTGSVPPSASPVPPPATSR